MHKSNLSERRFLSVAKKMLILEYKVTQILYPLGWSLPAPIAKTNVLFIEFVKNDETFSGEICVTLDDHPNQTRFTFYIKKSFEENNYRYSLRNNLVENERYTRLESKIAELTDLALKKYYSWDKGEIIGLGKKERLKLNST